MLLLGISAASLSPPRQQPAAYAVCQRCVRCDHRSEGWEFQDVSSESLRAMRHFTLRHASLEESLTAGRLKQLRARLDTQRNWSERVLPAASAALPVMYMFSGMDLLTAAGLFPQARRVTLFAEHALGSPECFTNRSCVIAAAGSAAAWFRHTAHRYFRTTNSADMRAIFSRGVLPAMLLSLHLLGHEIVHAEIATTAAPDRLRAIVLHTHHTDLDYKGSQAAVRCAGQFVYVEGKLQKTMGGATVEKVLRLANKQGAATSAISLLFKAGSHVLTTTRWFRQVLDHADVVMADESGPSPSVLNSSGLVSSPWGGHGGRFEGIRSKEGTDIMEKLHGKGHFGGEYPRLSAELTRLYLHANQGAGAQPLPFSFGYYKYWAGLSDEEANARHAGYLIVSTRRASSAATATAALARAARSPTASVAAKEAAAHIPHGTLGMTPALRLWVILTTQRSGSSWLEAELSKHSQVLGLMDKHEPMIRWSHNHRHHHRGPRGYWYSDRSAMTATDKLKDERADIIDLARAGKVPRLDPPTINATLNDYIADLASIEHMGRKQHHDAGASLTSQTHLLYKIMWNQIPTSFMPKVLEWLRRSDAGIIHLVRRNSLLSLVSSLQTAEEIKTGKRRGHHVHSASNASKIAAQAQKVYVEPKKARKFTQTLEAQAQNMMCWAASLGSKRYIRVTYEDLLRDAYSQFSLLWRFMGLRPVKSTTTTERTFYRVHSTSCADRISNYNEVLTALSGSASFEECTAERASCV